MAQDFQSQTLIFGLDGLDLQRSLDKIASSACAQLSNIVRHEDGGVTSRAGVVAVAGDPQVPGSGSIPGLEIHSLVRLNELGTATGRQADPSSLVPRGVRVVAAGDSLFLNWAGILEKVYSGISGLPLIFVVYRPPLSGKAWVYIADSAVMLKLLPSPTGTGALVLPVGLPAPANPDLSPRLDEFDITDAGVGALTSKDLLAWPSLEFDDDTGSGGVLFSLTPASKTVIDSMDAAGWTNITGTGGAPTNAVDAAVKKEGAASTKFATTVGGATAGYWSAWAKSLPVNLARVDSIPASNEDHIHFWVQLDRADLVAEVRLAFILSNFDATKVPGDTSGKNDNYYVASVTGAELASQVAPQTQTWIEFGSVGRPLRRDASEGGSFTRVGSSSETWADVKGVIIVLITAANGAVNFWLDDLSLRGGAGQDSSFTGNQPYDYRYRHYDPRTGVKGNPCEVSPEWLFTDSVRQGFVLRPDTYGDPEVRQQFFRRGGTLVQDWYKVGENDADGSEFTDTKADAEIVNAELLEIDNDQPVTTVDAAGEPVLAQPLPVLFGPIDDVIYGLGDPYRKGNYYWSKPGDADAWPAANTRELVGSSDELIAGCVWQNQAFCYSRTRGFVLYLTEGRSRGVPTGCMRGPVYRTALCAAQDGMYFVSADGVFVSRGGVEQAISDSLRPLFYEQEKNGYKPVDFSKPEAIRLVPHGDFLFFLYQDTTGFRRLLVYSFTWKEWRPWTLPIQVSSVYSEPTTPKSLVFGTRTAGFVGRLDSSVTTDYNGISSQVIGALLTTGALDQQLPRQDKLYGDLWIDCDPRGNTITVETLAQYGTLAMPSKTITGSGRKQHILDPFTTIDEFGQPQPLVANNIQIKLSWFASTTPPIIHEGGPSYIPQPETTKARVTDWSNEGRPTIKLFKGILLEVDTAGEAKTVEIQGDGATKTTISATASGRQSLEFSWEQFPARLVRMVPDATPWILYSWRWIFDEEPAQLARWETQELTHGISGWHSVIWAYVVVSSSSSVDLQILCYGLQGALLQTLTGTLPPTGGAKKKFFLSFAWNKGLLFKYVFTPGQGGASYHLYREESSVLTQAWAGGGVQEVRPFGSDDLDLVRGLHDAGLGARRSGGAGGAGEAERQ